MGAELAPASSTRPREDERAGEACALEPPSFVGRGAAPDGASGAPISFFAAGASLAKRYKHQASTIKQGIKQGREQGIKQGIKQGIEHGIERGIEQGMRALVIQMLENGMSPGDIMSAAGVSEDEIKAAQKENKHL